MPPASTSTAASSARLQQEDAAPASAVSWGAILAGAAAAAALSLILLVLGMGLGLASMSPWTNRGASAGALGTSGIVWITLTSLLASGLGGYLAGRLRTKWLAVHGDEVHFRDTAHGLLAWGVATLATAALLTSTIAGIVGAGVDAGASVAGGAVAAATVGAGTAAAAQASRSDGGSGGEPMGYFLDALWRRGPNATPAADTAPPSGAAAPTAEVGRIFANAARTGSLPPEDARYVGQLVAERTGLAQADAEKRVNDTFARLQTRLREAEAAAREAADKARKAGAYASLWLFVSLLVGAFSASLAATWGGRERDA